MVRNYKRKKEKYTDVDVGKAMEKLKEGTYLIQVAKTSGISRSSIISYRNMHHQNKKIFRAPVGRRPNLNKNEEDDIVTVVSTASSLGWPCDRNDICEIIGKYCRRMNRVTQFKNYMPGEDFMINFFKRHKAKLTKRKAVTLKVSRAKAEDPAVITEFIDLVGHAYKRAGIRITDLNHAKRVFNTDETGFNVQTKKNGVIVPVGRPAQVLAPNEGKTSFSVLVCGNAVGEFVPPYILYKGSETSIPLGWCMNGPPNAAYNTTKSGWMDQDSFTAWVKWFNEYLTRNKIQKPVVLFMDGCTSHISLIIVEEAKSHQIFLVKLPPNSTHLLQALDVGVFAPSKMNRKIVIRNWYRQTNNKPVTKKVFPALFAKLYEDMIKKPENLVNGFRATGIWPLNKEIILEKVERRGIYKTVTATAVNSTAPDTVAADVSSTAPDTDSAEVGSTAPDIIPAEVSSTATDTVAVNVSSSAPDTIPADVSSTAPVTVTAYVSSSAPDTLETNTSITTTGIVVTASTSTAPDISLVGISDWEV